MQVVTAQVVKDKKVLLRLDIDVSIEDGKVVEDYRLVADMPTLELCLEHARSVIILGHIDRPHFADATRGKPDEESLSNLNVGPIYNWLVDHGFSSEFDSGKLRLLQNLRFEKGEEEADVYFAKELATLGNFYVNEAFASHHPAASTTVLPMLLPHAVGLRFAKEAETLKRVRTAPKSGLVAIVGGVKVEDKLPAVLQVAKIADKVLVGGKIASELLANSYELPGNVYLANLRDDGEDITPETVGKWAPIIYSASVIVWNGPLGKVEDPKNNQTEKISQMIIETGVESIVGGGDTISYLDYLGDLPMFSFVSTGGGAMLEFLIKGTLPTIEALK